MNPLTHFNKMTVASIYLFSISADSYTRAALSTCSVCTRWCLLRLTSLIRESA